MVYLLLYLCIYQGDQMSINTISANATVDYSSFRKNVYSKELVAPFYADIAGLEGVDYNFTTMTEGALSTTSTNMSITNSSYAVDSNGFFGTDFNQAVGIPNNIKIHQTMFIQAQGEGVDAMSVMSKVWTLFKTISGNTLDPNQDGYVTQQEINAMPKSYISKGFLMDGIVSIQNTLDDMNSASHASSNVSAATDGALDTGFRGFMAFGAYSRVDTDPNIALFGHRESFESYSGVAYDNDLPKDKIAVGELFNSFFYQKVDSETAGYISAKSGGDTIGMNVNSTKEYYKFLQSGKDMETYLTETKGKDYLEELKRRMSMLKNGQVDLDLGELFFAELDKNQKDLLSQYNANNYAELDSISTDVSKVQIPTQMILEQKNTSTKIVNTVPSALSYALQK